MRWLVILIISILSIHHAIAVLPTTEEINEHYDKQMERWKTDLVVKYNSQLQATFDGSKGMVVKPLEELQDLFTFRSYIKAEKILANFPEIMKDWGNYTRLLNLDDLDRLMKISGYTQDTAFARYLGLEEKGAIVGNWRRKSAKNYNRINMEGQIRLQFLASKVDLPTPEPNPPHSTIETEPSLQPALHRQSVIHTASRQSVIRFSPYNQATLPHPDPDGPGPSGCQ